MGKIKEKLKDGEQVIPDKDLEVLSRPYPDWFGPEHIREWDYVHASCPTDFLKTLDYNTVVAHVTAIVEHARAATLLRTNPMLEVTPNGHYQASPYYGIMNRQAEIILRTAVEMGFTPSARARVIPNGNKKKKPGDPTAEFF
jgi:P27 family predicted phage terminase small subunit